MYDPFNVFPARKTIGRYESGWDKIEEDSEYTFRAMIHYEWNNVRVAEMFPPTQLKSVDHKSDFMRELLKYKRSLRDNGKRIIKVAILQGGVKQYEEWATHG